MGAEGRKRLLNGLFVTDVRKYLLEDGQLCSLRRRQKHPRLHHQRKETHQLQGHGLAAGVGARDDESVLSVSQFQRNRND